MSLSSGARKNLPLDNIHDILMRYCQLVRHHYQYFLGNLHLWDISLQPFLLFACMQRSHSKCLWSLQCPIEHQEKHKNMLWYLLATQINHITITSQDFGILSGSSLCFFHNSSMVLSFCTLPSRPSQPFTLLVSIPDLRHRLYCVLHPSRRSYVYVRNILLLLSYFHTDIVLGVVAGCKRMD